MSGVTPFAFLIVSATIGLAAVAAGLRWREPAKQTPPVGPPRPIDGEAHTLTYLGPDGRPNPLRYETFADYPTALTRQRAQARLGKPSIVRHTESGEVRIDLTEIFGGFRPIGF